MNRKFWLRNLKHWVKRAVYRNGFGRVSVGAHTYGAPRVRWWGESANLEIGRYCSIAEGVEIFLGGNHRVDWITTYPFMLFKGWPEAKGVPGHPRSRGDVVIGHDVWLGAGCVILSGVTIGHGAVIGCRAVVARDVAPYQIVAGNPATSVRQRFTDVQIGRLLAAAWWDWTEDRIRKAMPDLLSGDIERFLSHSAKDDKAARI